MQSIPLAVLKHNGGGEKKNNEALHAIHTACGIETLMFVMERMQFLYCMQSIPLAVLKQRACSLERVCCLIACNPYRLRYFFIFRYFFSNDGFFYGIMKLSRKCFVGRDSNVCHLYDVGGYESN